MKVGKATSKYFRTLIFLLFFFLNEAVPNAAFAFSSLNACAKSRECLALIKESAGTAVSAPTGAGYGVTTLRTTTSSGAIKTFVNGVADFAIVVGPSAAYVGWHYWNEAHNGRAQDRAKQRYCATYPTDTVCGFTYRSYDYPFYMNGAERKGDPVTAVAPITHARGCFWGGQSQCTKYYDSTGRDIYQTDYRDSKLARFEGPIDGVPWKDWSQAKRDRAVSLLNDADWQRLTTSMPVGGTLDPGDSVKAPEIGIPGQEWDNPNTPLDDRRFKSIPEEYPRPTFPDFDHDGDPDETDADDDNDGFLDPYDLELRNPYVPRASSEPPPPPEDDRVEQSDGERAVSEERQSQGDFLEKPGNEAFQNRLDRIEDKYKRAAEMEEEAATDPDAGFEQQRLIDEANAELQQLREEIKQAWWSSLSIAEQQLFGSVNSGDIDEIRSYMEQWSPATFEQDAQTYEEAVARNIVYHANDKGYSNPLEYLRDASNFDTARAVRTPTDPTQYREDDTARWENPNTKHFVVVDKKGRILTYGKNP